MHPEYLRGVLFMKKIDTFCLNCGKKFKPRNRGKRRNKWCSPICRSEYTKKQTQLSYLELEKTKFCVVCGKSIRLPRNIKHISAYKRKITCSTECAYEINRIHNKENKEERLDDRFCIWCGKVLNKYTVGMSDDKYRSLKFCSFSCNMNHRHSLEHDEFRRNCEICGIEFVGKTHQNVYCPKCKKERVDLRVMASTETNNWRTSVFERDYYTCQICFQWGGRLNSHHIIPWIKNKELRLDVDNGITLCHDCHWMVHRGYKSGKIKPKDLMKLIKKENGLSLTI